MMETRSADHRTPVFLGFDIGGTNTRARLARVDGDAILPGISPSDPVVRQVASKADFLVFLGDMLARIHPDERLDGAAFAFAGPVENHAKVRMTNWPEGDVFTVDELSRQGIDSTRIVMINDMVAGSYGLIQRLKSGVGNPDALLDIRRQTGVPGVHRRETVVFIAPGTGLGAAGVIHIKSTQGGFRYVPISSEGQHTYVPALDARFVEVTEQMRMTAGGAHPSWEDVTSGRGLVSTYEALRALDGVVGEWCAEGDKAAHIATAAIDGADSRAVEALDIYYQCLGAFAQMLALTFHAYGGVYIGGASTRKNWDYIPRSRFVSSFLANEVQGHLLEEIPVTMVRDELNLNGALWCAANREADMD